MNLPTQLFIGQVIAMLSIPLMYFATPMQIAICALMYFGINCLGMTMGYHRYFAHKTFNAPKWLEYVMLFFGHIHMVGPVLLWCANHREHHRYADTPDDPHSPYYKGWFYAHFLQVFTDIKLNYVRDLLKNDLFKAQHSAYWQIMACWAVFLMLIDPYALVYAWLAPTGLSKLIGSFVFSYSHRGRKPNSDTWLGLLTFGEGFHNTHHDNPKLSKWHPLDIGGHLINWVGRHK